MKQSIDAYREAVALDPGYVQAHSNLVYLLAFHPAYDDYRNVFPGTPQFDAIISIEVIEHLYSHFQAVGPGGCYHHLITADHGYVTSDHLRGCG